MRDLEHAADKLEALSLIFWANNNGLEDLSAEAIRGIYWILEDIIGDIRSGD